MFRFKQFVVHDDHCAMKVGTDGILLGAWADGDRPRHILDIGCGSGLIALMLAQRYPAAKIDAVDIDSGACHQAGENFCDSPWNERLRVSHADIRDFAANSDHIHRYSLIVSNPPWFQDSLKSGDAARDRARHADTLMSRELLRAVDTLLAVDGRFSVILPADLSPEFLLLASREGFHCHRACSVRPKADLTPKRCLMELRRTEHPKGLEPTELIVENDERHDYTQAFRELTREFYLRF